MAGNDETSIAARAIVAHEPVDNKPNWKIENLTLRALEPNELLVRIVATGICHTDIVFGAWPKEAIPYPKVLGHEGQSTDSYFLLYILTTVKDLAMSRKLDQKWKKLELGIQYCCRSSLVLHARIAKTIIPPIANSSRQATTVAKKASFK